MRLAELWPPRPKLRHLYLDWRFDVYALSRCRR
jgi:hypothetical protein